MIEHELGLLSSSHDKDLSVALGSTNQIVSSTKIGYSVTYYICTLNKLTTVQVENKKNFDITIMHENNTLPPVLMEKHLNR